MGTKDVGTEDAHTPCLCFSSTFLPMHRQESSGGWPKDRVSLPPIWGTQLEWFLSDSAPAVADTTRVNQGMEKGLSLSLSLPVFCAFQMKWKEIKV